MALNHDLEIVIPNYNGAGVIAECLNSLSGQVSPEKIVVVDDCSSDDSVALIRSSFSGVRLVTLDKNGGFSKAVNTGIAQTSSQFVFLLNTDVQVMPGLFDRLIPYFDDGDVFAVSPKIIVPRLGDLDEAAKTGVWHHGMLFTDQLQGLVHTTPALYTTACAAVYRRSMLAELGGFDEIYSPFYWEDVDLGYRAWKRGWKSIYQPEGTVYHHHAASTSTFNRSKVDRIKARNSFLFIWRNITDSEFLRKHRAWLPLVLTKHLISGDKAFVLGWLDALRIHRKNKPIVSEQVLRDREIFDLTGVR